MARAKPKDYAIVTKSVLEACKEPKSIMELSKLLTLDRNILYRVVNYLREGNCLKVTPDHKIMHYLTMSFDFVYSKKSNYMDKNTHIQTPGSTIYTLDKPFNRNEDCYHTRHIESQRLRNSERKSAKAAIGISSIYTY